MRAGQDGCGGGEEDPCAIRLEVPTQGVRRLSGGSPRSGPAVIHETKYTMPPDVAQATAARIRLQTRGDFLQSLMPEQRQEVERYQRKVFTADAAYQRRASIGGYSLGLLLLATSVGVGAVAYGRMPSISLQDYRLPSSMGKALVGWAAPYSIGLSIMLVVGGIACIALNSFNTALRNYELYQYLHPKEAQEQGAFMEAQSATGIPKSYELLTPTYITENFIDSGIADGIRREREQLLESGRVSSRGRGGGDSHQS